MKIEIDLEDYIKLLELRKNKIKKYYGWDIPDMVWDYFLNLLYDGCVPTETNPSIVVDNIAINGDYGPLEEYIHKGESKEDAINRIEKEALYYDEDIEYVIMNI